MLAGERHDAILKLLKEKRSVSASTLAKIFGVSLETVRRDLYHLETRNLLQRVHGGAVLPSEMHAYKPLTRRLNENIAQKIECAESAMHFIEENDILFIDSGSTAVEFARVLRSHFQSLTVITHSLDVCFELRAQDGYHLIVIGGEYAPDEAANCGFQALEMIASLHASKAFVFPLALSLKKGICDQDSRFVPIQKAYIQQAQKIYFVADSTKFEATALAKLCDLDAGCTVITDSGADDNICSAYRDNGIEVYYERRGNADELY